MKRLSRHTVVVLLVLMLSSIGGMSVAVVAFGQSDATTPLSGYTTTTSAQGTTPLSSYTAPTSGYTNTTVTAPSDTTTHTSTSKTPTSTVHQNAPSRSHGRRNVPTATTPLPSRVTRSGPTHLAFTGGEP